MPDVSGERLTADDHIFVIMEQVMGVPVVPQVIWRVSPSGPVGDALDAVEALGGRLARGRLSRLVRRSRGPVRDRWEFTPAAGRTHVDRDPVEPAAVSGWVAARLAAPLDSVHGPSWELAAVPTTDGDLVVSLVRSHVVADGAAMIRAVSDAVAGTPDVTPPPARRGDTVRDAASLLADAARAAARVLRPTSPGSPPPRLSTEGVDGPAVVPTVAVRVDADRFAQVAASVGGTSNTLFQAVTLGVLVGSGRVGEGDTVPLAVPMSVRGDGFLGGAGGADGPGADLRANATTGATVRVTVDEGRYRDLGPLRAAAKEAYREVDERNGPDQVAAMAQIAQALPDALVRRAAEGSTTPMCLASNLGEPSSAFTGLGLGNVGGDVALRSVVRADSAAELARRQGGVSAWAVRSGSSLSLSFTSLDPVHIPDQDRLLDLVARELEHWGLEWGSDVVRWL